MIVEIAGVPGAGKTTLGMRLARELTNLPVSPWLSPGSSLSATMRNIMRIPLTAIATLSDDAGRKCLRTVDRRVAERSKFPWRYARLISATRRLGNHAQQAEQQSRVHIVDEGVLGILNLAFSGGLPPSIQQLNALASLIPVSDVVVILRAPVALVVRRARQRLDGPREWKSLSSRVLEQRLEMLQALLLTAVDSPRFRHAIVIDAPQSPIDLSIAATRAKVEVMHCSTRAGHRDT